MKNNFMSFFIIRKKRRYFSNRVLKLKYINIEDGGVLIKMKK